MVVPEIRVTPAGRALLAAVVEGDGDTLLRIARFSDELAEKVKDRMRVKADLDRSIFEESAGEVDYD
jgi:hypothetical protein